MGPTEQRVSMEPVLADKPNGPPQREEPAISEPAADLDAVKVPARFSPNNLDIPAFLRRR